MTSIILGKIVIVYQSTSCIGFMWGLSDVNLHDAYMVNGPNCFCFTLMRPCWVLFKDRVRTALRKLSVKMLVVNSCGLNIRQALFSVLSISWLV